MLSRNSRSTTPASRTPTPSLGQFGNFSMSDLGYRNSSDKVSDKHIIPIVTVFDDLKDYLSDSDLSLEYQIARQRRRHKNTKNLNKQAQLSNILIHKNKLMGQKEHAEMREDSIMSVPEAGGARRNLMCDKDDKNNPSKSASRLDITRNVFESEEISVLSSDKKSAEFVKNEESTINSRTWEDDKELASHKDPLWKNKQGNDFAVRKINSSQDEQGASPSGQSLESTMEGKTSIRDKTNVFSRNNGGGQFNTLGSPRSLGRESLHNKWQQEKENSCNNFYQTHSLQRRKPIKPSSSLGSLIESFEPKTHKTSCQDKLIKDPLFTESQSISNDATNGFNGFATSFSNVVNCSKIQPKFAAKKSVEDCAKNLNNQQTNTEPTKNGNISEMDIIRQYMGFDADDKNHKQACGKKESFKNPHEFRSEILSIAFSFNFLLSSKVVSFIFCQQTLIISHLRRSYPGDSPKNGEKVINLCEKQRPSNGLLRSASADFRSPKSLFKSSSSGLIQKSSSGDLNSSKLRSLSAEPEFLRFWLEKDRAINKVDMRTSCKTQSASPSDKGIIIK